MNNPNMPQDFQNYFNRFENSMPKEDNNDYLKSKKVNIKGNQSEIVDEKKKPEINIEKINNENIHLDNDIEIDFPDIKLFNDNYSMNLKNIHEFLNKYIIYCRIFPLYIRHLKKNKKDLKDEEEKLGLLIGVYNSIRKRKENELINSIAEEYIKIFEEMIIKLKNAKVNIRQLDFIKGENKNEYSYIQPPNKKELYRKEDRWKEKG